MFVRRVTALKPPPPPPVVQADNGQADNVPAVKPEPQEQTKPNEPAAASPARPAEARNHDTSNRDARNRDARNRGTASNQPVEIELSDAKVSTSGVRKGFSVHYKFTRGGPQPGVWLHWVIKAAGGQTYADDMHHFELGSEGTLSGTTFGIGSADRGPFEMWVELGPPSPFAQRPKVSNTITAVEGTIAESTGNPSLDSMRQAQEEMRKQREKMMEEQRKRLEDMRRRPGTP
jgi:hypothetical protein